MHSYTLNYMRTCMYNYIDLLGYLYKYTCLITYMQTNRAHEMALLKRYMEIYK